MGRFEELNESYAVWNRLDCQTFFSKQLYSDVWWLEALPLQATKANAALRLKEQLGCDRIVFFGDGENDLSLFRIADEAYAPANAVPAVKELATGIIGSNAEDGVALWLEQYAVPTE